MYVIKRTDQGGGYLAAPGSAHSYTKNLERARIFATRDAAERERCPENEVVKALESCLTGKDR